MPVGSNTFHLVSVPVDVGSDENFFADKEYLAAGTDAQGHEHFYITWTFFSRHPQSPIMLTDSTDGVHWRTTMVSASDACAQGSNPVPARGSLYVSWSRRTLDRRTALLIPYVHRPQQITPPMITRMMPQTGIATTSFR